ncbi:MAG: hypothetical protein PHD76_05535 [Methylacidiphilales bacterium]|nr:hypothetical protein [Candidatus Methylacidiphilales bacterium]
MKNNAELNRRSFLGVAGISLLGLTGLTGCTKRGSGSKTEKPPLDSRFTYDVSQFEHTDPALLLYRETESIPAGLEDPKCLAIGPDNSVFIGGDSAVKQFDHTGQLQSTIALAATPFALCVTRARLCVALKDHLEIFDGNGKPMTRCESPGDKTYLTGVADAGDAIYLADAGHREIIRCDSNGKPLSRFGHRGNGNPGFVIPSPYFHVLLGGDGLLWVNNPGRHQIEAYTTDGKFELAWGTPSMAIEGFCGCCNPVYFTRRRDGKFVTSEKGLNRIKIYDAKGTFEGVVAGPELLVKDLDLAKKACADCQVGFGFDVACDSNGRVLALDPATKNIRIFTLKTA